MSNDFIYNCGIYPSRDDSIKLSKFPRKIYTSYQTPLERLIRLERELGKDSPMIYIKRDDLSGLTLGGNKTRKLEFLISDALKKGADCIITCGAIQSNHCRLTLSASNMENLPCYLVLEERVPGTYNPDANGNNFLYYLMGVKDIRKISCGENVIQKMHDWANELRLKGKTPYIIPGGGASVVGTMGYIKCMNEMDEQARRLNIKPTHVVCASGSGGTHAGLLTASVCTHSNISIVGISVKHKANKQVKIVRDLAIRVANHIESKNSITEEKVIVFDKYVGDGYSIPTESMIHALQLLLKTEGILLDPVYTGKAFAGFLDLIYKGYFKKKDIVIFIHTGGSPAIYAYTNLWMKQKDTIQSDLSS